MESHQLKIGGIPAEDLVKEFGSPLYVYNARTIREQFKKLNEAVTYQKKRLHYAMKANSNIRILQILLKEGAFIDTVSPEEVMLALEAGFKPEQILFTGINLSDGDMRFMYENDIRLNIGSLLTLKRYGELYPGAQVSIRINPDMGAGHHDHCVTGGRESKFGIFDDRKKNNGLTEAKKIITDTGLKLAGIHAHIGSGILDEQKFIDLMKIILGYAKDFPGLEFIDVGGGIGIPYRPEEKEFDLSRFGAHLGELMHTFTQEYGSSPFLALEPGRFLVAESGFLLTTVTDIKETPKYKFIGVDSGFNHLIRPMAYGSYHPILNASRADAKTVSVVVSGYLCESGDVFTRTEEGIEPREIPLPERGDVLAITNAGAYGFSMSSNYNSRIRPAEVLVDDGVARLIRRREALEDILKTQV